MKILMAPESDFMAGLPWLRQAGHEPVLAADETALLGYLGTERPDMCLFSLRFAHVAAAIKRRGEADRPLPVLLCADGLDSDAVARFRDSRADDLIVHPCNMEFVLAKIAAVERNLAMNAELRRFRSRVEREILLAQSMFHRIADIGEEDPPGIDTWSWPAGHFAGDFIACGHSPSGRLHAMLVDATGHGLAAAVATIPAVDAFHELLAEDRDMPELIERLNQRLYRLLPTGHFCAAGLVRFDPERGEIACWNGGLPPMLALGADLRVRERFVSRSPPLGILPRLVAGEGIETCSAESVEALVVYSDGVTETLAPDGSLFGESALIDCLAKAGRVEHLIPRLRDGLVGFTGGLEPVDDISMISIRPHCLKEIAS